MCIIITNICVIFPIHLPFLTFYPINFRWISQCLRANRVLVPLWKGLFNIWNGGWLSRPSLHFFLDSNFNFFRKAKVLGAQQIQVYSTSYTLLYKNRRYIFCYMNEEKEYRIEKLRLMMGVGKHKGNFTYLQFWLELTRILSTSIMSYKIGITDKQYVKALKWPNNQTDLFQNQSRSNEHRDDYFDFFLVTYIFWAVKFL